MGFLVYTWIKVNAGIYAIFNCFGGFCLPAGRGGTLREKQNYFQITIRAPIPVAALQVCTLYTLRFYMSLLPSAFYNRLYYVLNLIIAFHSVLFCMPSL